MCIRDRAGAVALRTTTDGTRLELMKDGSALIAASSTAFALGGYHWIAVSYDGALARFYVDSNPVESGGSAYTFSSASQATLGSVSYTHLDVYKRQVVTPHMSGSGEVSLALGVPAGPLFMFKLKRLAETALPAEATDEQIAPVAIAQQVVESLARGSLDLGNADIRGGVELFNGLLLTTEQITTLKALAETQSTVSASDVSRALRGPWE